MALRKAGNVWVYQCSINGRTWSHSTGQSDKKLAAKEVPRLRNLAELLREQPKGSLNSLLLSQAIMKEVARLRTDVSERQAERASNALLNFRKFAGDTTLDRIDTGLLERYQRKRLSEVAQRTVGMELSFILRLLRLNGFPTMRPTFKRGRVTEQRHFTQDELERFFRACPPDSKTLYALMLVTGAREAELVQSTRSSHVALLKSEVDLDRRFVTIRTAKTKPGSKSETRILPIPEKLVEPLQRRIASVKGPHLFQARWDSCKKFNVILRRAGIPKKDELGRKVTSHSFRHTYATLMAEAVGNNQFLLMKLLGHKQVSTTERYCHPTAPIVRLNLDLSQVESCKIVDVEVGKSAWVV